MTGSPVSRSQLQINHHSFKLPIEMLVFQPIQFSYPCSTYSQRKQYQQFWISPWNQGKLQNLEITAEWLNIFYVFHWHIFRVLHVTIKTSFCICNVTSVQTHHTLLPSISIMPTDISSLPSSHLPVFDKHDWKGWFGFQLKVWSLSRSLIIRGDPEKVTATFSWSDCGNRKVRNNVYHQHLPANQSLDYITNQSAGKNSKCEL